MEQSNEDLTTYDSLQEQFNKEMGSRFEEEDFNTFIPEEDLQNYADIIATNENDYFKTLLCMKHIHHYNIYSSENELKQGYICGCSPEELYDIDLEEISTHYKKYKTIADNSRRMLAFYEKKIDSYIESCKSVAGL